MCCFCIVKKSSCSSPPLLFQITLTHQNKIGYHVLRGTQDQREILTTCTHITSYIRPSSETTDDRPDPASCTTIKIVKLYENDKVFIEEIPSNTAANYSKTTSFFGLIKIDDIQ
ncbi:hypothetical protein DPMN_139324 [Dreissena polymorpha]|uniref:Uncharacterized protein n=1 Tax=Dreissena polymorpha TaxID=45954 RepID=A0A9D4G5I1_DREPO|nr:hypothetical protein DPMN_139324 [Dreissena polymorpha]